MRRFLASALLLSICIGCGDDKTDPRDREGFIDTSDPSKVRGTMNVPGGNPAQPGAVPPGATGPSSPTNSPGASPAGQ